MLLISSATKLLSEEKQYFSCCITFLRLLAPAFGYITLLGVKCIAAYEDKHSQD